MHDSKSWHEYPPSPPEQISGRAAMTDFDASVNAISFGFVATAVLISIFLIMAILEHLLRPRASTSPLRRGHDQEAQQLNSMMHLCGKIRNEDQGSCLGGYTVLMPGFENPTHLAQPAPLPCPREGILWPSHAQHHHDECPAAPCHQS